MEVLQIYAPTKIHENVETMYDELTKSLTENRTTYLFTAIIEKTHDATETYIGNQRGNMQTFFF